MTRELFEEYDLTVAELNKENQELKKQLEESKDNYNCLLNQKNNLNT